MFEGEDLLKRFTLDAPLTAYSYNSAQLRDCGFLELRKECAHTTANAHSYMHRWKGKWELLAAETSLAQIQSSHYDRQMHTHTHTLWRQVWNTAQIPKHAQYYVWRYVSMSKRELICSLSIHTKLYTQTPWSICVCAMLCHINWQALYNTHTHTAMLQPTFLHLTIKLCFSSTQRSFKECCFLWGFNSLFTAVLLVQNPFLEANMNQSNLMSAQQGLSGPTVWVSRGLHFCTSAKRNKAAEATSPPSSHRSQ